MTDKTYRYMVETCGSAQGQALYSREEAARDCFENAPLPEGQYRVLWAGKYTKDEMGIVRGDGVAIDEIEGED